MLVYVYARFSRNDAQLRCVGDDVRSTLQRTLFIGEFYGLLTLYERCLASVIPLVVINNAKATARTLDERERMCDMVYDNCVRSVHNVHVQQRRYMMCVRRDFLLRRAEPINLNYDCKYMVKIMQFNVKREYPTNGWVDAVDIQPLLVQS